MKKLGSKEHLAVINVQEPHRAHEILTICNKHDWRGRVMWVLNQIKQNMSRVSIDYLIHLNL